MNHLNNFFNYIKESTEHSKEEIEELLVPIKDLGVSYTIGDKTTITEGDFSGNEYLSVRFTFNEYKKTSGLGYSEVLCDDRIWDFFDELISLRNRLENDKIFIHFYNSRYGSYGVNIMFVTGEVEENTLFRLKKAHNVLRTKYNKGTTDFYYSMIMKLDEEEPAINIKVDSFTKRKLTYFLKGVDMSDFNIEYKIVDDGSGYGGDTAHIKITPKD